MSEEAKYHKFFEETELPATVWDIDYEEEMVVPVSVGRYEFAPGALSKSIVCKLKGQPLAHRRNVTMCYLTKEEAETALNGYLAQVAMVTSVAKKIRHSNQFTIAEKNYLLNLIDE